MLSKNQVVAVRKAIEKGYVGKCTIVERQKVQKPNKSTGFEDVVILENQPCKLSFESIKTTNQTSSVATVTQSIKVFLSPEITVKTGSKIIITQNDMQFEYTNSGEPAVFSTHQELMLTLFDRWS